MKLKAPKYYWVIRDIGNSDGNSKNPFPRYVWAARTRDQARLRADSHKRNPKFSTLGPVEKWGNTKLFYRLYEKVGGISEHWPCAYYKRKDAK